MRQILTIAMLALSACIASAQTVTINSTPLDLTKNQVVVRAYTMSSALVPPASLPGNSTDANAACHSGGV